jgi:hypothetical protein
MHSIGSPSRRDDLARQSDNRSHGAGTAVAVGPDTRISATQAAIEALIMAAEDRAPLINAGRDVAGYASWCRASIPLRSQRDALGQAEAEAGRVGHLPKSEFKLVSRVPAASDTGSANRD